MNIIFVDAKDVWIKRRVIPHGVRTLWRPPTVSFVIVGVMEGVAIQTGYNRNNVTSALKPDEYRNYGFPLGQSFKLEDIPWKSTEKEYDFGVIG